jgi:putative spermidine/putrescine transport system substrate-binding protein
MEKRTFLKGATSLGFGTMALGNFAWASGRPLTFVSWGGALSDMETQAFVEPFGAQNGVEVISTSPTKYAKIKAMVQSGNVEWDVVTVGGRFAFDGADKGILEEIDYSMVPNAQALDENLRGPYGVATSLGATVMAWNTGQIKEGPETWADFWDTKRFPGARGLYKHMYYNYEIALLAAGLKADEIYPVTDEKINMMFAKLNELKPDIRVWWGSGSEAPQLLSSGELTLCSAYDGRIKSIKAESAPVDFTYGDGLAWGNVAVVPKGTPNKQAAMELINYAVSAESQERIAASGVYAPVLSSVAAAAAEDVRSMFASAPENISRMLVINEKQAAHYVNKYQTRWQEFQLA